MGFMTCSEVMSELEALANDTVRQHNTKYGVGENQFGVKMGDIRALAKPLKKNPALAQELWATGNLDARLVATLLMKPAQLSVADLETLVASLDNAQIADWFSTNVLKPHPQKESVRERWMDAEHEFTSRMGWSLTAERIIKKPEGLELSGLLDRIEAEMADAPYVVQWTMNYCLAEIGIHFPEYRYRAIKIGEKIGAFRDFPVSKGCVSPYAPIWITEMVRRTG